VGSNLDTVSPERHADPRTLLGTEMGQETGCSLAPDLRVSARQATNIVTEFAELWRRTTATRCAGAPAADIRRGARADISALDDTSR
jgi:hypothetical protein